MNDHSMTKHQAELLAAFIAACRDWQVPGTVTALAKARNRGDVWQVAIGALRAAANPGNKTPAIIALDGAHWRPANPDDEPTVTPTARRIEDMRCPHCGMWSVRGENHTCGRVLDPDQTRQAAAAARAAIKNPPEESQP